MQQENNEVTPLIRYDMTTMVDTSLDHIRQGGTLTSSARALNLTYNQLLSFIRQEDREDDYQQALSDRCNYISERVLDELLCLATYNVGDLYDENNNPKKLQDLPNNLKRAVKSIRQNEVGAELKFEDKLKAIELLGKTTGMFKDTIKHEVQTLETLITESMENGNDSSTKKHD